jgi:peptidoglycan LD-endopeptidase CwlK
MNPSGVSRQLIHLSTGIQACAENFLRQSGELGIDVLVTCTYRSREAQAALYAMGRTVPGSVVTNARPGESLHNCCETSGGLLVMAARAFDVVPMVAGKPQWSATGEALRVWQQLGDIGEACGLQWAGRWSGKLREFPHFQI